MNKYERQSRDPAGQQALPKAVAGDLAKIRPMCSTSAMPPSIAPHTSLTPSEVRTILMSLC